jgi:glyoxylase I family protein
MTIVTEPYPPSQAVPTLSGFHHLGLTVRDIEASEAWYTKVLGLVRAFVEPHPTGDGYAVVMTHPGTGLFLGLDYHPDADREMFNERRTGLDHLALQLSSRSELDEWITHLDALGVDHGPLSEGGAEPAPFALVVFHDPDRIPIELIWFGA